MKLDWKRPYQTVYGPEPGVYEQDGKMFTSRGDPIEVPVVKPVPPSWERELLCRVSEYMSRPEVMHALDRLGVAYSKFYSTAELTDMLKEKIVEVYGDK